MHGPALGILGWPSTVLLCTGGSMLAHRGGVDETPERLHAAWAGLERAASAGARLLRVDARAADAGELELVHTRAYVEEFRQACAAGAPWMQHPDCPISPGTWTGALAAAGAAAEAAHRVARGEALRAFCAVRPPGHHAHAARAGGFCYFNNAAVAARVLAADGRRVLMLDLDNHHGDGSESLARACPLLAYGSLHGDPRHCYPGTGAAADDARIVDVPLPCGAIGSAWLGGLAGMLDRLAKVNPDALVISFGCDALAGDPLGDLALTQEDLALGCRAILERFPSVPVVSVLEGGYELGQLGQAVQRHVIELSAPGR